MDGDFLGAQSVYAADVDGDGDMDVLGAAAGDDQIAWWRNTAGDGTFWIKRVVDGGFGQAHSVYAADVDGDGDVDVLGAAQTDNDITWWENAAGDGTVWIEHTVDGDFGFASSVYAADVDGDGDMDVLGVADSADDITWWENTAGDGTVWIEHTVDGDFDGARSVYAADVDGDGNMDILGAARNADDITWWEDFECEGLQPAGWCPSDLDGDGIVGAADLVMLLGAWGTNPGGSPDFNGDGVVNAIDLIELLGNWGPCP